MGVPVIRTYYHRFIPGYWLDVGTNTRSPIVGRRIAVTAHTQTRAPQTLQLSEYERAREHNIVTYDNIAL